MKIFQRKKTISWYFMKHFIFTALYLFLVYKHVRFLIRITINTKKNQIKLDVSFFVLWQCNFSLSSFQPPRSSAPWVTRSRRCTVSHVSTGAVRLSVHHIPLGRLVERLQTWKCAQGNGQLSADPFVCWGSVSGSKQGPHTESDPYLLHCFLLK